MWETYAAAKVAGSKRSVSAPELAASVTAFQAELVALEPDELSARVLEAKARIASAARAKADQEERARIYNRAEGNAEFEYWGRCAYWKIDEAVVLSMGKDPRRASWAYIKRFETVSPFARECAQRHELATRARSFGQLWELTNPGLFLGWAKQVGLEVPNELVEAVRAAGTYVTNWKDQYDNQKKLTDELSATIDALHDTLKKRDEEEKRHLDEFMQRHDSQLSKALALIKEYRIEREKLMEELQKARTKSKPEKILGTKERDSLLKLVIGMAKGGYGFVPDATRSPIAGEIASDLALAGIPLDEDTVRKYLVQAKQFLPQDEAEQTA
ncbi:MAG: hypothetical protein KDJ19_15060 [Hyphomicrobiaceae bacterium]|nr:hypothetical protein [Hyphomicrobiaceae bacterium]